MRFTEWPKGVCGYTQDETVSEEYRSHEVTWAAGSCLSVCDVASCYVS